MDQVFLTASSDDHILRTFCQSKSYLTSGLFLPCFFLFSCLSVDKTWNWNIFLHDAKSGTSPRHETVFLNHHDFECAVLLLPPHWLHSADRMIGICSANNAGTKSSVDHCKYIKRQVLCSCENLTLSEMTDWLTNELTNPNEWMSDHRTSLPSLHPMRPSWIEWSRANYMYSCTLRNINSAHTDSSNKYQLWH